MKDIVHLKKHYIILPESLVTNMSESTEPYN